MYQITNNDRHYRFLVEWIDPLTKLKRIFVLTFYEKDNSLEMYEPAQRRMFLKRMKYEDVKLEDFYKGGMVNVLSRQLLIAGYADRHTEAVFGKTLSLSILIVKESGLPTLGKILDCLYSNGLSVIKGRIEKLDGDDYIQSSFFEKLGNKFAVFEVRGKNVMDVLMQLLHLETMISVEIEAELGDFSEHCLTPTSENECQFELEIFFPKGKQIYSNTMEANRSTACIIKPHAIKDGTAGKIIQDIIDNGFIITAFHFLNFSMDSATEFYEIYKGVVDFYNDMVTQLISGPCIALEIKSGETQTVVEDFRKLVGPYDSVIAKNLRPETLRAKYGENKMQNAVHCTDLPEDGKLDVEYLFYIIPSSNV